MKYILSTALFSFLTPLITFAQDADRIVPCGYAGGPACEACHLVKLADNILRFLIEIGAVLGTISILVAGFILLTSAGNQAKREKGKSIMTNTIVGFLIMLLAWLAVDTVIKTFADKSKFGVWNQVQCVNDSKEKEQTEDEEKGDVKPVSGSEAEEPDTAIEDLPRVGEESASATTSELWACMQKTLSPDVGTFDGFMEDQFANFVPSKGIWFKNVTNATEILSVAKSCGADEFHVNTESADGVSVYVGIRD